MPYNDIISTTEFRRVLVRYLEHTGRRAGHQLPGSAPPGITVCQSLLDWYRNLDPEDLHHILRTKLTVSPLR